MPVCSSSIAMRLAADLFAANSTAPVEELSPVDAVPTAYVESSQLSFRGDALAAAYPESSSSDELPSQIFTDGFESGDLSAEQAQRTIIEYTGLE